MGVEHSTATNDANNNHHNMHHRAADDSTKCVTRAELEATRVINGDVIVDKTGPAGNRSTSLPSGASSPSLAGSYSDEDSSLESNSEDDIMHTLSKVHIKVCEITGIDLSSVSLFPDRVNAN